MQMRCRWKLHRICIVAMQMVCIATHTMQMSGSFSTVMHRLPICIRSASLSLFGDADVSASPSASHLHRCLSDADSESICIATGSLIGPFQRTRKPISITTAEKEISATATISNSPTSASRRTVTSYGVCHVSFTHPPTHDFTHARRTLGTKGPSPPRLETSVTDSRIARVFVQGGFIALAA